MKLIEPSNNFHVIDEPLDAIDVIRQRSVSGNVDEEPLYLCDISDIINKHAIWKRSMPRVLPFYAVKCNDSPIVLQTLATLGTGFDCASKGEIAMVMNYGVAPQSIIYANPTKPISHLKFAAEMNVSVMTVDSEFELLKIKKHYPDAKLILRIRCDAKVSQCPLGEKYGCNPDTEAPELIDLAMSLGLKVIGISFHVGSGCMDPPVYAKAIQAARKLFDFAASVGYHFTLLDIGGGFPGDKDTDINEIASIVNRSIDLHFPSSDDVTIIAEPGRFYVSSAYTLACRVHSKREIHQNGKFKSVYYYINDGVYGSFNCNLYDHKIVYPITLKATDEELFKSTIWGPTCDALDQVCENVSLPQLNIDDFIIFENMGAYTIPIASPFNGFPLPKVEYYVQRKHLEDINATTASHEYILLRGN
ncbi:ornithine decarboxylase 1-like [Sitodiplosis mosellana]|uniref:ornithine decarboxylase 1-like n=1 Tax=Sitodiplosis mosellana TaxID=263140 RepID=UPI0024443C09|nr:ornithine decarboxylase 1-like [Sitodiplosis mosellana]